MCHTSIKPPTSTPTAAAGETPMEPAGPQPHTPQQELPPEHTDTQHNEEQGSQVNEAQSLDESSETEGPLEKMSLQNLNSMSCADSSEGNPSTEEHRDPKQRTNQPEEANSVMDSEKNSTDQPEKHEFPIISQCSSSSNLLREPSEQT